MEFCLDGVVYFKLKGRGKDTLAMVSEDKWDVVSRYEWYLGKSGYPICYQLSKMPLHKLVYKMIIGPQPFTNNKMALYIDHIDHNKLNNTDQNLRLATPAENARNKQGKNNFKGVRRVSENNYTASLTKDGKKYEIKNLPTKEAAAEIYNMMAEEMFGNFAALNNIS